MIDTSSATPTELIENDRVKVTRWDFEPSDETGHHRHAMDYLVVPMTNGQLKLHNADGTVANAELTPGGVYFRTEGVEHNVINAGNSPISFIEIELK